MMSKLEFVAIQFAVKFAFIWDLQGYVDRVCQRYLNYFTYFENLLFHAFTLLYHYYFSIPPLLFHFNLFSEVIVCSSLYGFATLDCHFLNEDISLRFDWPPQKERDGVAFSHIFIHLKLFSGK